jgi:hypothetical protein
MGFSVIIP